MMRKYENLWNYEISEWERLVWVTCGYFMGQELGSAISYFLGG